MTAVSTVIDIKQFVKEPNLSNGADVVIDGLTLNPTTSWVGVGVSFAKMGIEVGAEKVLEFAVKSEQKIDNYIEQQMINNGSPNNWDIPDNGIWDVIFGGY
mgnify:CR=1 FL=1